uniref:Uncharacterized protein n=1 Tax=Karlodinium veneficum TaxID=407301 RepID=A3E3Z0_KARVE|nr:unknown [Karlodinium veneficum]
MFASFIFLVSSLLFGLSCALEPLAMLAIQPVWQAAKPIPVNIDYDVPAFGTLDELADLRKASLVEYKVAQRRQRLTQVAGTMLKKNVPV